MITLINKTIPKPIISDIVYTFDLDEVLGTFSSFGLGKALAV